MSCIGRMEHRRRQRKCAIGCGDKKAYATQKRAKTARSFVRKRYDKRLEVYRCRFCRQWHLTSQL